MLKANNFSFPAISYSIILTYYIIFFLFAKVGKAAQRGKLVITAGCRAGCGAGCRCCGGGGRGRTTAGCHCTCCGHCAGYLQKAATRDLFHTIVLQLVSGRRETASCLSLCRSACIQHLLRAAIVTKNTYFHKSNIH